MKMKSNADKNTNVIWACPCGPGFSLQSFCSRLRRDKKDFRFNPSRKPGMDSNGRS